MMKKRLIALVCTVAAFASTPALAQDAELGPMVETFACDYKAGKSSEDVMKAGRFWADQVEKSGSDAQMSYMGALLMPIWSGFDADFYWVGASPNLNTMMQGGTEFFASKEGEAAQKRFRDVMDCTGSTYLSKPVVTRLEAPKTGDQGVAEVYVCTLNEGIRIGDLDGADAYYASAMADLDIPVSTFRWTPMWANTQADVVYLSAYPDAIGMAASVTSVATSRHAEMLDGWYNSLVTCESGVFGTTMLRAATAP